MSDLTITAAGPGDLAVLAALHGRCFVRPWSEKSMQDALSVPGTCGWIAMSGGEPVGLILIRAAAGEAEILTIGVDPATRQAGIGRKLAKTALGHARDDGISRMYLEVAARNTAARRLYSSLGFEKAGERAGYYPADGPNSAPDDALILAINLKNP